MTAKELQDRISNVTAGIAGDGATRFNYYAGYTTSGEGKFGRWSGPSSEDVKTRIASLGLKPQEYSIGDGRYNFSKALDDAKTNLTDLKIEEQISGRIDPIISREKQYDSLSEQIRAITGGQSDVGTVGPAGPAFNQALSQLSAGRNYGSSDLGSMLNFQVSDQQIVDDYNNSKLSRLNSVIDRGNAQIAGISERLKTANDLLTGLPTGDARRTTSEVLIKQLNDDLQSVTGAVTEAQDMQKNFTPITMDSPEGLREITSFRSFLQLPEERASQQLYQIDPDSYRTAVSLGQKYREMATQPIEPTTTPETEQLRRTIEDEAMNQLRLGSTIGAEERRGYEQAIRGAQTARGNIFGLGPAVQEAAQIGAAGEQRKLARFGAAQQFLGSGETSGAARARDLLLREGIQQNRLGAASGFIAGGPSIYNLANQRTAQQQGAMQGYIQANQSLPGGFNQQPSTASPFFQAVDQSIPVALTGEFNKLYNTQSNYLANTYGAQADALSRVAVANSLPNYISAGADVLKGIGSMSGTGGIFACWVAREVYGADNPKWLEFREWMFTKASDNLRNFYLEYGERIAKSIRNKPKIKAVIRKWMDRKIG
jgi:hypothetical protein